jgi:hypothetical protein
MASSCRRCGNELDPTFICPACEQFVQWKCASCGRETDVSVHSHECMTIAPLELKEYYGTKFARRKEAVAATTIS